MVVSQQRKDQKSSADLWVFVLYALDQKKFDFIIIPPRELLKRFQSIHGKERNIKTYFSVTKKNKCWETRNLKKPTKYGLLWMNTRTHKETLRSI